MCYKERDDRKRKLLTLTGALIGVITPISLTFSCGSNSSVSSNNSHQSKTPSTKYSYHFALSFVPAGSYKNDGYQTTSYVIDAVLDKLYTKEEVYKSLYSTQDYDNPNPPDYKRFYPFWLDGGHFDGRGMMFRSDIKDLFKNYYGHNLSGDIVRNSLYTTSDATDVVLEIRA